MGAKATSTRYASSAERWDVIVVGAGIAGVVAAEKPVESGGSVLVLERRKRVGVRCVTRSIEGSVFDYGARYFTIRHSAFQETAGFRALKSAALMPIPLPRAFRLISDEDTWRFGAAMAFLLCVAHKPCLGRCWCRTGPAGSRMKSISHAMDAWQTLPYPGNSSKMRRYSSAAHRQTRYAVPGKQTRVRGQATDGSTLFRITCCPADILNGLEEPRCCLREMYSVAEQWKGPWCPVS